MHERQIEMVSAEEPDLLADCQQELNVAMRNVALADHLHGLDDRGHTALIVRPQDRRAIRPDDAVFYHDLYIRIRLYGIEMSGKEYGRYARHIAPQSRDQIAAVPAGRPMRLIPHALQPDRLQPGLYDVYQDLFVPCRRIDAAHLQEQIDQALFVDHAILQDAPSGRVFRYS